MYRGKLYIKGVLFVSHLSISIGMFEDVLTMKSSIGHVLRLRLRMALSKVCNITGIGLMLFWTISNKTIGLTHLLFECKSNGEK